MKTEIEMLNKISYDDKCKETDYTVGYLDSIQKKLIYISYYDVIQEYGNKFNFCVAHDDGTESEIPFHRIKDIKKKGKSIWSRKW